MHVLIDSCIYLADPKRDKPPFRAIVRLAKAGALHLHIPAFVRGEILTHAQHDARDEINKARKTAAKLLAITDEPTLVQQAQAVQQIVGEMEDGAAERIEAALDAWITEANATVHPVATDHGVRVAEAYFAGKSPFRTSKFRDDLPDSFIWETALDLVNEFGELIFVSADGRLWGAAEAHNQMDAYKTLEEFIKVDTVQDELTALIASAAINNNLERIKGLLPNMVGSLAASLENDVVSELSWKTVRHSAIPDDNGEASISGVGTPETVEFAFEEIDDYGEGEFGIPFTATVECELNFTIYKGDYYTLSDEEDISVSDWSDHYFNATKSYTISIEGHLTLTIDTTELEDEEISDGELQDLITGADTTAEITEYAVYIPEY